MFYFAGCWKCCCCALTLNQIDFNDFSYRFSFSSIYFLRYFFVLVAAHIYTYTHTHKINACVWVCFWGSLRIFLCHDLINVRIAVKLSGNSKCIAYWFPWYHWLTGWLEWLAPKGHCRQAIAIAKPWAKNQAMTTNDDDAADDDDNNDEEANRWCGYGSWQWARKC